MKINHKIKKQFEITISDERLLELFKSYPEKNTQNRLLKILSEFVAGFSFLSRFGETVSFFGTARCAPGDKLYYKAERLAYNLVKSGLGIVTGGGPGVMEAANKGAYEANGISIGINIQLQDKQRINKYVKEWESFHYFFTRKVMLSFSSQAYIFFPGGFGTLDEFFEMITLVQTEKIKPLPIVLVHKKYWAPLLKWLDTEVYKKFKAISPEDRKIYHLVDGAREATRLIKRLINKYKKYEAKRIEKQNIPGQWRPQRNQKSA